MDIRKKATISAKRGESRYIMIIDLILDRIDGFEYNSKEFYCDVMAYENDKISSAMDAGDNKEVQNELCNYIDENGYKEEIKDYIMAKNWL